MTIVAPRRPSVQPPFRTLVIRDVEYHVERLDALAADITHAFRLTKQAGAGNVYDVHHDEHGSHCDCPDFVYKRDGLDPSGCKHVKALRAFRLLPAIPPMRRPS